ncbi:helix-turn-helix domain-containing protein [Burkholderia cenocepacia]|uniref:helix-turn-helix domain-containing protein n=1 Tax=Burkholderia cenocepacia TaxID=95486 RepID=UPI002B248080|nr:helix-turn-helix domain-containing protein [Burkholderia cenocepacia]MEB2554076.1 helix-turn-helix domain-containing protein [Burkholderia cenocepacia]
MNTLGTRIKSARKEAGLTQVELAKKVHITQPTLSDLENGHTDSTSSLVELAMALGVRPEWLATGKGDRKVIGQEIGENSQKEIPSHLPAEAIPSVITQLRNLQKEIEKTLDLLSGLPGLSSDTEDSYGRDVSPFHNLGKEVAERIHNLRPEVTHHAKSTGKARGNKP